MLRALACLVPLLFLCACERPRVLVLGLDGASWSVMDPLMDAGYLPVLREVVRAGARGEHDCTPALSSLPCFCPPVWVSLATGHGTDRHHVFREGQASTTRGVKAVWDVLHAVGGTATAISMRNTWPPEETLDYVMTEAGLDYAASQLFARWPADLPVTAWDPDLRTKPPDLLERLEVLPAAEQGPPAWAMFARDRVAMRASSRLLRTQRTDLTWIVLHSPDKAEHMMWPTVQPHAGEPVDPARVVGIASAWTGPVTGYGWGTVASQYLEIDAWLGTLLAEVRFDYVLLVSDHGMARNEGEGLPGAHGPGLTDAHRGILVLRGPGIRRGADLGVVDVRDFAPTLAYLLELPIGDDLPGRVLEEAFTRGHLRRHAGWRVDSWESDPAQWQPPPRSVAMRAPWRWPHPRPGGVRRHVRSTS